MRADPRQRAMRLALFRFGASVGFLFLAVVGWNANLSAHPQDFWFIWFVRIAASAAAMFSGWAAVRIPPPPTVAKPPMQSDSSWPPTATWSHGDSAIEHRVVSVEGPLELVGEDLMLRIPLEVGGAELAPLATGIGQIEGDCLRVIVQPWLAKKLEIRRGSLVIVDNRNGKFTITRSAKNDGTVH